MSNARCHRFRNDTFCGRRGGPLQTRTKIVATVGPACRSLAKLAELVQAGVDVFRLNMAHAKREEHLEVVNWIRDVSKELGRPIAILADLAGPKIRLGQIPNDLISCHEGELFRFVRGLRSTIQANSLPRMNRLSMNSLWATVSC